jgi:hypothetical protein
MATDGVSITRATPGVTVLPPGGKDKTQGAPAVSSGTRNKSATAQTTTQVVNIEGQTFNRRAPRGTYLNIVV